MVLMDTGKKISSEASLIGSIRNIWVWINNFIGSKVEDYMLVKYLEKTSIVFVPTIPFLAMYSMEILTYNHQKTWIKRL